MAVAVGCILLTPVSLVLAWFPDKPLFLLIVYLIPLYGCVTAAQFDRIQECHHAVVLLIIFATLASQSLALSMTVNSSFSIDDPIDPSHFGESLVVASVWLPAGLVLGIPIRRAAQLESWQQTTTPTPATESTA
ncbi:MAG: hypothetical protein GC168_19775 [Candidatus Hydrogenedens sp.]|nr:hypothetical protein [Candidatus Hydrogenedens sp.]